MGDSLVAPADNPYCQDRDFPVVGSDSGVCLQRYQTVFTDWRNVGVAAVSGLNQHSVVALRQAQFDCVRSDRAKLLSEEIIRTKVRNQRAVILYFSKYLSKANPESADVLRTAAEALLVQSNMIGQPTKRDWRETLLGTEGMSANIYWGALAESGLLPESFQGRCGRGATEIVNAALNYGYSILMSYVWAALDNAGLELYAGIFHKTASAVLLWSRTLWKSIELGL